MKFIDIVIIIVLAVYCLRVLYKEFHKEEGCNHICSGCTSTTCNQINFDEIYREIKEEKENG